MLLKKLSKAVVVCSVLGLLVVAPSVSSTAQVTVNLKSSDMWVNSDKVSAQAVAVGGKVSSKSKKPVSYVIEYRGTDSRWHYDEWYGSYSAGTTVPTLNSTLRSKCDWRLQLNPYGVGDDGKGGIASGYLNVVK